MNFIKIMEKAEEKAIEEMKCDGENNNVGLMETDDGALPKSEQEPAEGSVMIVDEVFNDNDSQEKRQLSAGQIFHICYNPCCAYGTMTDGCVPMELICPPFTWNITKALIQKCEEVAFWK
jgi:hypothetical protein